MDESGHRCRNEGGTAIGKLVFERREAMELLKVETQLMTASGKLTDLEMENAKLCQQLERAQKAIDPLDVSVLRGILNNWRGGDSLVLASPRGLANQLLVALDAIAIVHGTEEESRRVDAMLEKVFDAEPRRP